MLGQPRQALEDAKTSTGLDTTFEKGWTRLARCCVLLGDTVTAKQALSRLGELGGENTAEQRNVELVERLRADGQQAHQAGDYRRALYCLDKALELATHSLLLKVLRAECLAFLGRYTEVRPLRSYSAHAPPRYPASSYPLLSRPLKPPTPCCSSIS
jgi:DnaJ family protein C protein 7